MLRQVGAKLCRTPSLRIRFGNPWNILYRAKNNPTSPYTSVQKILNPIYGFCFVFISGGPLSALTCCVNVRLLSGDKKNIAVNLFSKLGWELGLYYASYDDFHPDILARMYT